MQGRRNRFKLFRTSPQEWHRWKPLVYLDAHRRLQWFQLVGALLVLLYLTSRSDFFDLMAQKKISHSVTFFLSGFLSTLVVGVVMGWNRMPANFISLVLIWFLLFYCPPEVRVREPLHWIPRIEPHIFKLSGAIMLCTLIGTTSKLKISQSGIGPLVGNTLGTILSTSLLFLTILVGIQTRSGQLTSTQTVSSSGHPSTQLTSIHFRLTLFWAYVSTALTFVNLTFFLRILTVSLKLNKSPSQLLKKTMLETLIWVISVLILVPFVAAIHPRLSMDTIFTSNFAQKLGQELAGPFNQEFPPCHSLCHGQGQV